MNVSQEVVGGSPCYVGLSSSGRRLEHQEIIVHVLIHLHNSRLICTPVTVVRCREYRDYVLLMTPIISLFIYIS
jgi:hypothetical protein